MLMSRVGLRVLFGDVDVIQMLNLSNMSACLGYALHSVQFHIKSTCSLDRLPHACVQSLQDQSKFIEVE